ncbi:hypothetical protein CNMCM6106_009513 [Aspergillus hiratsukae]|uniref:Uncharacterized protein n=1 Tax=Aspergillus hiratsukae TaxID=1194566 RepID=A0A8H6QK36_9EURO|nr:hypothetical protein CNMCM6106_009513 [Aspergillus hiratsukae]
MLWDSITARFGTTKAQERYNLLRDMCALKLDGSDYMGHQAKWLKLMADLDRLDVTIDDVKHDLFIQSLGSWQSGFVKSKLDEFFATGVAIPSADTVAEAYKRSTSLIGIEEKLIININANGC